MATRVVCADYSKPAYFLMTPHCTARACATTCKQRYIDDYFPKALETAAALNAKGEGYTYTTHSWPV